MKSHLAVHIFQQRKLIKECSLPFLVGYCSFKAPITLGLLTMLTNDTRDSLSPTYRLCSSSSFTLLQLQMGTYLVHTLTVKTERQACPYHDSVEPQKRLVVCSENEALAEYMLSKWQEMADKKPKGISENIEKTLTKAYSNVCNFKNPVKTLKEFSQLKGVGKWILKLMQGYFDTGSGSSEPEDVTKKGEYLALTGDKFNGAGEYLA